MTTKKFIGIDYSMTNPAICIHDGSRDFSFANCEIHFLTARNKFLDGKMTDLVPNVFGYRNPEIENQQERFTFICEWAMALIRATETPSNIVIEDYSMGSKGRVFHIAENTGLLKHELWQAQKPFITVPPTVLKKFATGKGNSNKDAMYQAFLEKEKGPDLVSIFEESKVSSPISDIVDSYFFAKYALSLDRGV